MERLNKTFTQSYNNFKVHMIPCRADNYAFLLESKDKKVLMVDSTLKEPTMSFIDRNGLNLEAVLLTHHHFDHIDRVQDFQNEYNCKVYCSQVDSTRPEITATTQVVQDGDEINAIGLKLRVFSTPGHTKSHLVYFLEKENLLFSGDLIFSLGCGRVFEPYETVYEDFFKSLQKIKKHCNSQTKIYCAHEYTLQNFDFLESQNLADDDLKQTIKKRIKEEGKTVPTSYSFEIENNAFLKAKNVEEFKSLRLKKDKF